MERVPARATGDGQVQRERTRATGEADGEGNGQEGRERARATGEGDK